MFKCTQKILMKEIVTNTLIRLLIKNHKFRIGSETSINPVKVFEIFLQVKIKTFLPIHEKNNVCFYHSIFNVFSLSLDLWS